MPLLLWIVPLSVADPVLHQGVEPRGDVMTLVAPVQTYTFSQDDYDHWSGRRVVRRFPRLDSSRDVDDLLAFTPGGGPQSELSLHLDGALIWTPTTLMGPR